MVEIVSIVASCITTASIIISAIVCILQGFYFTRKDANILREKNKGELEELKKQFDTKLEKLKKEFKSDLNSDHDDVKKELEKLSGKIDDLTTQFITTATFQTYVESVNKLLEMYSDRTTRIETSIDDMRSDLHLVLQSLKK